MQKKGRQKVQCSAAQSEGREASQKGVGKEMGSQLLADRISSRDTEWGGSGAIVSRGTEWAQDTHSAHA